MTRRAPEEGGAWSASNSSSIQPTPAPRMMRPPDITSRVASILAVTTGLRYGTTSTLVPMHHPRGEADEHAHHRQRLEVAFFQSPATRPLAA